MAIEYIDKPIVLDETYKEGNKALCNILSNITKSKVIVFANVADMKADMDIAAGMVAKTLGYYSTNDGGGAYYVIRAKQDNDVDDGGSLHELASGLVAELIVENGTVNVKQFGAKNGAVCHNEIQNAINFAMTSGNDTIIFPFGEYSFADGIRLPHYIRLRALGKVILRKKSSDVYNEANPALITIYYRKVWESKSDTVRSPIIDGGFRLYSNARENSVAIKIEEQDTTNRFSRWSLANIFVSGFYIAMSLPVTNFYCTSFYRLHFEVNTINVEYNSTQSFNSGENIVFRECIFAGSTKCFDVYQTLWARFVDCSFDFNNNMFYINNSTFRVFFIRGHIETGEENLEINQIIEGNTNSFSYIHFDKPTMYLSPEQSLFVDGNYRVSGNIASDYSRKMGDSRAYVSYNKMFMCPFSCGLKSSLQSYYSRVSSPNEALNQYPLLNEPSLKSGTYTLSANAGLSALAESNVYNLNPKVDMEYTVFSENSKMWVEFDFKQEGLSWGKSCSISQNFDVPPNIKYISVTHLTKNLHSDNNSIGVFFYDKNGNEITRNTLFTSVPGITDEYVVPIQTTMSNIVAVPSGTHSITVAFPLRPMTGTKMYFGGLFVSERV